MGHAGSNLQQRHSGSLLPQPGWRVQPHAAELAAAAGVVSLIARDSAQPKAALRESHHPLVDARRRRDPPAVRFEVADDGVGMQPPTHGDGIGLRCMRDRIEAVGGRLEVVSSPGMGTRVRGRVPDAH